MQRERTLKVGERHPSTGMPVTGKKLSLRERIVLRALRRASKDAGLVNKFPGKK